MKNEQNFEQFKELIESISGMVGNLIATEFPDIGTFINNHQRAIERFVAWEFPNDNQDFYQYVVERDIDLYIRYREVSAALMGISNAICHFEAHQKLMQAAAWRSLQGDMVNAH